MHARRHQNSGFTLVEVSIVLVVIGLLIGSVLVAVNIMQSARITSTVTTLQSIQSAVSTYNQNYGAVPGDDNKAVERFTVSNNGGGDGVIGAGGTSVTKTFDSVATTLANGDGANESQFVWLHLRAAGLIKGQGTGTNADATQPGNSFGGKFGLQNGAFTTDGIALKTNVVCASNIPGDAAVIIDQRLDDGVATTGNMRAGASITGATSAYANTSSYVLCMKAL